MKEATQTADRPASQAEVLDVLVNEIMERLEAGEAVDLDVYAREHPERVERVRQLLPTLEVLAELGRSGASAAPGPGTISESPLAGTLGDFRLIREVGRGGMGIVYEAEQISLGRRVAVKVLPLAAMMDPKHLQRFHNEAKAAACLRHEHIIPVYFVGCERGVHFYAMQFIEGRTLAQFIDAMRPSDGPAAANATQDYRAAAADAPTPPVAALSTERSGPRGRAFFRQAAELIAQAADALEHAHSLGIVHRDIKPANLLLEPLAPSGERGRGEGVHVWVGDFGLARLGADVGLTMSGDLVGTLRYMAPEQAFARHGLVDHRADVYALGATLYELLTMRPAVTATERAEVLRQIAFEEPTVPRKLDRAIPAELETITLKCLAKNPNERYATAGELAEDLRRWLEDKAIKARPPTRRQRAAKWAWRHQAVVGSAALIALIAAVCLGWILGDRQARRREAERRIHAALAAAAPLLSRGNPHDPELVDAVRIAEAQVASGVVPAELRRQVEDMSADRAMLAKLEEIRLGQSFVHAYLYVQEQLDRAYAKAFREYGIDVDALGVDEAVSRIRTRTIVVHLATALDHRALARQRNKETNWKQLVEVARAVDVDPWRNALRDVWANEANEELDILLVSAPIEKLTPGSFALVGSLVWFRPKVSANAVNFLRQGQQLYPSDLWINYMLGAILLHKMDPPQTDDAVSFYRAALALRPKSPRAFLNLGRAMKRKGRLDEAIACFHSALRIDKNEAETQLELGVAFAEQGLLDKAIVTWRELIRTSPNDFVGAAYFNIGLAFSKKRLWDESIVAYREALRHGQGAESLYCLADILATHPDPERRNAQEAVSLATRAVQLKSDDFRPWIILGVVRYYAKDFAGAIEALQKSMDLHNNNDVERWFLLAMSHWQLGQKDEARKWYNQAVQWMDKHKIKEIDLLITPSGKWATYS